ncbi:hypothetical protein pb186bvf_014821 [Paramecium bursaria]
MNINQIILTLIFLFQQLHFKCVKHIQDKQTIQQNQPLWMNYQIKTDKVEINNLIIFTLTSENETQILLSYKDQQFQFSNQALNYYQIIKGKPGDYMKIEIPIVSQSLIQINNFQSQMKFLICLDADYLNTEYIIQVQQSNQIFQQSRENIDVQNLGIRLWFKLILQDEKLRFIKLTSEFGDVFNYNFGNKLISVSQNIIQLQQSLFFNVWFYFEINFKQIQVDLFEVKITIKSFYVENYKQTIQFRYSFNNQLTFRHQSGIFANFQIIQDQVSIRKNFCQPDCQLCDNLICLECKVPNKLDNGICLCQNVHQTTDQNGTCIYPAQFMKLEEIQQVKNEKLCPFGQHYSEYYKECLPCFNDQGLLEIKCVLEVDPIKYTHQQSLIQSYLNLVQIQTLKCPRNCLTCQVKNKVISCNRCKNGILNQNQMCISNNKKHCEIFSDQDEKAYCYLCEEFYSLNELNQCVYSKRYQMYHIKQILSDKLNTFGKNCDLFDKQCIYCSEGYVLIENSCVKKTFTFMDYYSNQQALTYKPHLNIFQDGIQINKSNLLKFNIQKNFYEESIKYPIFIYQQQNRNKFIPSYYNSKQDQLSFCHSIDNCINKIQLNLIVVKENNSINLLFEYALYSNLSQILDIIEIYDITPDVLIVNVSQGNSAFDFHDFFQAFQIQKQKFNIHLLITGQNLTINKTDIIKIYNYSLIYFKEIIIDSNYKQNTLVIQSDNVKFKNVYIVATVFFQFYNQTYIIFDRLVYYGQTKINNQLLMIYYNDQSASSELFIKNSIFNNLHFYNSSFIKMYHNKSQFQIFNCSFQSLFFSNSFFFNTFTNMLNITLVHSRFEKIKFKNDSHGFIYVSENINKDINTVIIKNLLFLNVLLDQSFLFYIENGFYDQFQLMDIQFSNQVSINSSLLYVANIFTNIINIQNIFCFDLTFVTSENFFHIKGYDNILIKNFYIKEVQGSKNLYPFVCLVSKHVTIENYFITNIKWKLRLFLHLQIMSITLKISFYEIKSQDLTIYINQDMKFQIQSSIIFNNIKYTDIIFDGDTFISLEIEDGHFISQDIDLYMTTKDQLFINQQSQKIFQIIAQNYCKMLMNHTTIILDYGSGLHKMKHLIQQQGLFDSHINDAQMDIINMDQSAQLFKFTGKQINISNSKLEFKQRIQSEHQNYLFSFYTQQIFIDSLVISIKDRNMNCMEFVQSIENQQSIVIQDLFLTQHSHLRNFIILEQSDYQQLTIINMQAIKVKLEYCLLNIFPKPNFYLKLINLNCVLEFFTQSNAIIISQPQLQAELKNITIIIIRQCESVLNFLGKQLLLNNIKIQNIVTKGIDIEAQILVLDGIYITQSNTSSQLINIKQTNCNQFLILNIFIQGNNVSNNLINIYSQDAQLLIIQNIYFSLNRVGQNSLMLINIENYLNQRILYQQFVLINNTCETCIIMKSNLQKQLKLSKLFSIGNTANNYFNINNIQLTISQAIVKDQLINYNSTYIESNGDIKITDSNLIWSQGTLASYQNNLDIFNSSVTLNDDQVIQSGDDHYKIPDKLQLQINQPNKQIKLLEDKRDNIQQYRIDSKYYGVSQYTISFPSGQKLKNYKILDLKSKQFNDYINYININGVDFKNIKINLNKCYLLSNIDQSVEFIPNYVNSQILLSDVILIANPYVIQQFTLQIQCIYNNITLCLNINAKMFKCQIGEILYQNKCQQCNITNNQQSVNKRSQVSKYIDHNYIEDYKIGLLKLKDGYWRPFYSNDQIELCKIKENCLGGWDVGHESCQTGYLGPLCNECDIQNIRGNGHYSKYKQQCFECEYNINVFYMIVIIVIQLITLIITTRSQYLNNQRYQQLIYTNKYYKILNKLSIDQISVVFKQIQNYFFYIQFIDLTFDVDLNLGLLVNFAANPIQLLNPYYDCISQYYNYSIIIKLIFQIVTPLFIIILFYIIIIIINKFYKFKQLFVFIYVPLLYFFIIYQIIIFQNSISQITYVTISGIKWINGSRSEQFFEKQNINQFIFASLLLFIFAIVIPLALMYIQICFPLLFTKFEYGRLYISCNLNFNVVSDRNIQIFPFLNQINCIIFHIFCEFCSFHQNLKKYCLSINKQQYLGY